MEIATGMIREYFTYATSFIGDIGGLPESVTEYRNSALIMKKRAEEKGDLEALRLAIDYLLLHPNANAPSYASIHYHYDQDEMQEVLLYIRSVVWPEAAPLDAKKVKDVKIVPMSTSDWWDMRKAQGLHPAELKNN
jgi:hypothetical protein